MKDELLEIDVRLLLLRHGRQKVIEVLARLTEQSPEDIHRKLRSLERTEKVPFSKTTRESLLAVADSESRERPEIAELLRTIAINYENRVFLPNLRDVERFLDRLGAGQSKLKSRSIAGPILIRALSELPHEELAALSRRDRSLRESDYSLLSRAIMGTPRDESKE